MQGGYGLKILTPQTGEPIAVADVYSHSRIFASDADAGLISLYITAARDFLETLLDRQFVQVQYLMTLDSFPGRTVDEYAPPGWRYGIIRMPRPPLVSVDAINYVDAGTLLLTLLSPTQYQVSTNHVPGLLAPSPYNVWPVPDPQTFEAVQVTFTCGYPTAAAVPERIKYAIKLLVAHMYENREPASDLNLSALPYGLRSFIKSLSTGELA